MELVVKTIKPTGRMSNKYTYEGAGISPPLSIENVKPEAESLALIFDELNSPGEALSHWLIWNLPPDIDQIPEGIDKVDQVSELGNAIQGRNDFGELGYSGPYPIEGPECKYRFRLYALDRELTLKPGSKKRDLQKAMQGHIIEEAYFDEVYWKREDAKNKNQKLVLTNTESNGNGAIQGRSNPKVETNKIAKALIGTLVIGPIVGVILYGITWFIGLSIISIGFPLDALFAGFKILSGEKLEPTSETARWTMDNWGWITNNLGTICKSIAVIGWAVTAFESFCSVLPSEDKT